MKIIRRCLTLAAILIALPALADNQSQPSPLAADPDLLMLQTDLKVTLQHYEKLRAEAGRSRVAVGTRRGRNTRSCGRGSPQGARRDDRAGKI